MYDRACAWEKCRWRVSRRCWFGIEVMVGSRREEEVKESQTYCASRSFTVLEASRVGVRPWVEAR